HGAHWKHRRRAARAAKYPHMPCTPPPGGVDEEQIKRAGIGVAYKRRVGRKSNWRRFAAPPLISPPTRLPLRCSNSAGGETRRARILCRNPGANRSICDSILAVMSK